MNKSNLSFNDFIDKCNMRNNGLITARNFESFMLEQIKIRKYIPLIEKNNIIRRLISMLDSVNLADTDAADFTTNQSLHYLFNIILAYTNLEHSYEDITISNYDAIMKSGFIDSILDECESDYKRFISMLEEAMSYKNIFNINSIMNTIDATDIEEKTKYLTDIMSDEKIINNIEKIMAYNDPNMKVLQNELMSFDLTQFKEAIESLKKKKLGGDRFANLQ